VLAAAHQHWAILTVLLGLGFTALANGATLGVGREEDLGINRAADTVVLPVPLLDYRGR
jgi:hypothetical protein